MMLADRMRAAAGIDYTIPHSYNFAVASNMRAYRTLGTPTSRRKYSMFWHYKRNSTGTTSRGFYGFADSVSKWDLCVFNSSNVLTIQFDPGTAGYNYTGNTVTDTSSWHDYLVAVDTTQATAANRLKVWHDGSAVTLSGGTLPLNYDTQVASGNAMLLAAYAYYGTYPTGNNPFDGKIADFHYIDGTACALTDFFNGSKRKAFAGSFGAQGCWISFEDATSTTTLVRDDAGGARGAGAGSNDLTQVNLNTANQSTDVPT
jgi:hypothetical protein